MTTAVVVNQIVNTALSKSMIIASLSDVLGCGNLNRWH